MSKEDSAPAVGATTAMVVDKTSKQTKVSARCEACFMEKSKEESSSKLSVL